MNKLVKFLIAIALVFDIPHKKAYNIDKYFNMVFAKAVNRKSIPG
ncbi:hypothetical protein P22_1341 [Propionispora sp. 2/2-37]|nr:hypothetical protein [Propionispora sp. 2/2-37]CUH95271.1 hypothetical protein P22_1341 [Propionispora sp. 2/2-37]